MPQILIATLLMAFLFWSFNVLSKHFATAQTVSGISIKRMLLTVLLFIGCYGFITFTANGTRNEVLAEIRQEFAQQQENFRTNGKEENEVINGMDPAKARANDKTKEIRLIPAKEISTKFTDVGGLREAKEEVRDIIHFLQNPAAFSRLGAKSPKGVLLYGEPGTGKTLLARAIAGEANVSFIAVAGSEFDEEYVGVGAARVRQLFEIARENAPCIIFIDEIDALAHKRHPHDPAWSAQTVNQLLTEMDGLDASKNAGIVVIGASNRIQAIEPAMLRPGRLDRHIKLDIPTISEREEVLQMYLKKIKVDPKVQVLTLAKNTTGFSNADLANLVNEAAILATKSNKKFIETEDFDAAKDRIVLGSKRAALKVSPATRKIIAYHEAGHALAGLLLNQSQPLYKVTITHRGEALGHTSFEPKTDQNSINQQELQAILAVQLAGRIAEEIVFGEQNITTGAEGDLINATDIAYNMVTRWGYSKKVGLIHNSKNHDITSKQVIEQEIQAILQQSYAQTKELLLKNRDKLDKLAAALLERETLDSQEVRALFAGGNASAGNIR